MSNEKRVSDYIPDTEILAQMGEEFAKDRSAESVARLQARTTGNHRHVGCIDSELAL